MTTVTLRFKTDDAQLIDDLVTSWLENEGITIRTASLTRSVDLTYVKES
jgi:hypothetical protein